MLQLFKVRRLHILLLATMSTTEEKLDNLIASVASFNDNQRALNQSQQASQVSLDQWFRKLEEDFTKAQEDATERAIKHARREHPPEFKNKGHQEQFSFNLEVADHVDVAARKPAETHSPREAGRAGCTAGEAATVKPKIPPAFPPFPLVAPQQARSQDFSKGGSTWLGRWSLQQGSAPRRWQQLNIWCPLTGLNLKYKTSTLTMTLMS